MSRMILLDKIRLDYSAQTRAALDAEAIKEYAEFLDSSEGESQLPPVVIFDDGETLWLADGFHRTAAYRKAGRLEIPAEEQTGTLRDAILYACGANKAHGVRLTAADKRRKVEMMLADPEWATMSDRWIAETCKVSPTFVGTVRGSSGVHVDGTRDSSPSANDHRYARRGRDGKAYKVPFGEPGSGKPVEREPGCDEDYTEALNAKILEALCERCFKLGGGRPLRACDLCNRKLADIMEGKPVKLGRRTKSNDPRDKAAFREKVKNGSIIFDVRAYHRAVRDHIRQVDLFGNVYECRPSRDYENLNTHLLAAITTFREWYERVTKAKLPESDV